MSSRLSLRGSVRPLAVVGLVLLALGVASVSLSVGSGGLRGIGMTCSDSGCVTPEPLLYLVVGLMMRALQLLVVAGVVFLAGAAALRALGGAGREEGGSMDVDGAGVGGADQDGRVAMSRRPGLRRATAVRLWALAVLLVVGSAALGVWSALPEVQGAAMTCVGDDCGSSIMSMLLQLSYTLVPAAMLAGLLVMGIAIVVSGARVVTPARVPVPAGPGPAPVSGSGDAVPTPPARGTAEAEVVWDGHSHAPFRRPEREEGEQEVSGGRRGRGAGRAAHPPDRAR